ncbi:glycoside hydrolase family 3 N-terminal domain-containing protein [Actinotignum sp. GS-2025a]|uniref:glycoside hydrolase family 3 N-terminal domain-containing protein n=1 Tax=Actinotignum sp. GS-2025a TaxID=3427274 RepID=UPI003F468F0E
MKPWNDKSLPTSERVDALLSEMTLEDKAGQLGSYWERKQDEDSLLNSGHPDNDIETEATATAATGDVAPMEHEFAQNRLSWEETARYGLGHLSRIYGADPISVSDGAEKMDRLQRGVISRSRFNIPAIIHEECLTGITCLGATVFPAAIAWGATWNPELIEKMANAIGQDMHAIGVHQGLSPLLDVVRDYRWGRVEETCGEDPYLVGMLGTAYVRGLESAGVLATLKHFAGYPAARAGRNHAPVSIGPREFEDIILPSFEMAVREGKVSSVMNSYSDIDGEPAAASRHLLTDVLRQRWGFTGTVVSDYWSVKFLETMHRVAEDSPHAAALAVRAGLDVELPETVAYNDLPAAVRAGLLSEADLDESVRRVVTQKIELGLLDKPWSQDHIDKERDLDSPHNREIAREIADESIVLLKNDDILSLKPSQKAAIIGPTWAEVRSFLGCYSFPNHVLSRYEDQGTGLDIHSLEETLPTIFTQAPVFEKGTGFLDGDDDAFDRAVAAAREADIAVVTLGDIAGLFGGGTSGEGCDVVDLSLPGRQGELLNAILDTGTPTVAVLVTGRPYALGEYADRCAAIIQAFMPGVEGAQALTDVLSGKTNPSGRLPIAIPRTKGGQPGTYLAPALGWFSDGISNLDPRPLYPFGFGLSYTSFALSNPQVSATEVPVDGELTYTVSVSNTGERAGSHVVQLYATDPYAEVVRPLKQLIGFTKVHLDAGETKQVTFRIHADRFSFTGIDMQRIVEPGEILLSAGSSSEQRLSPMHITLVGDRRIVPEGRVLTTPVEVHS